jgi:hypothetical protein
MLLAFTETLFGSSSGATSLRNVVESISSGWYASVTTR